MKIDYQEVRAIPIALVLEHYDVELQERTVSGDVKLVGRCPIHTDGKPARNRNHFQATIESDNRGLENTFHCFACEARGSVIDLVVLMEKLVAVDSVDWEQVSEDRKSGSQRNWCPLDRLNLASRLLHTWFLEGQAKAAPSKPPPLRLVAKADESDAKDSEAVSGPVEKT